MFVERVDLRTRTCKVWEDPDTRIGKVSATTGAWHYESTIGSGVFDAEYDYTLQRVNNAQLNGYVITASDWHFALQTEPATGQQPEIGSFGFGGRQGEHWLWQRLDRVGYIHRPTGTIEQIAAASYDPADVSISNVTKTLGPGHQHVEGATITWANVIGNVSIRWELSRKGIIEKIDVPQATRQNLPAPSDGTWLPDDTYLAFAAEVDWSDVPRRIIRGVVEGNNSDFWDDGDDVTLENASQQLLGVLPTTYAYVENRGGSVPLFRRFHHQGGRGWCVFGCRLSDYQNLLPGDMVFDPPVSVTATTTSDDGYEDGYGSWQDQYNNRLYMGQYGTGTTGDIDVAVRFPSVTGPSSGDTISATTTTFYRRGNSGSSPIALTIDCDIGANRQNALGSSHRPDSGWTASTQVNTTIPSASAGGSNKTTGDFATAFQDVVDLGSWASGDDACVAYRNNGNSNSQWMAVDSVEGANPAQLDFTYAAGGNSQIDGTVNLAVTPAGTLVGTGALAGTASLALAPTGILDGLGELIGTMGLSITPDGILANASAGQTSGVANLVFTPSGTVVANGELAGAIALALAPTGTMQGAGALAGSAAIVLTPSGTVSSFGDLATARNCLQFVTNATNDYEYAVQDTIPNGFGDGEFTMRIRLRCDPTTPIGSTVPSPGIRENYSTEDRTPYGTATWWYDGNFLLDGFNNNAVYDGTFAIQIYGSGRIRWLFADGSGGIPTGFMWAAQAAVTEDAPSILDGSVHTIELVRRWAGASDADLELWVDGVLIGTEQSDVRTNMATTYWDSWTGYPAGEEGWFWGSEKLTANGDLADYPDFKGELYELDFYDYAKTTTQLQEEFNNEADLTDTGLVGRYAFPEGTGSSTFEDGGSDSISLNNAQGGGWWTTWVPPLLHFYPRGAVDGLTGMAGTASLALTPSATLTGSGALAGAVALAMAPTGVLDGLGALAGSVSLALNPAGTMQAVGELAGTTSLTFGITGTVQGTGALAGSASLTFTPTGTIAGTGELTGSVALVITPTGNLTAAGSGAMSGTASLVLTGTATLTAFGALAGSSSLVLSPTGVLVGTGALGGSVALALLPTGTLGAFGELAGLGSLTITPTGNLTNGASGSIAGTSNLVLTPTGTIEGLGELIGSSSLILTPTASPGGVAPISGSIPLTLTPAAIIQAIGELTGGASLAMTPLGSLDGIGELQGAIGLALTPIAALQGVGALAGLGTIVITPSGVMINATPFFNEAQIAIDLASRGIGITLTPARSVTILNKDGE